MFASTVCRVKGIAKSTLFLASSRNRRTGSRCSFNSCTITRCCKIWANKSWLQTCTRLRAYGPIILVMLVTLVSSLSNWCLQYDAYNPSYQEKSKSFRRRIQQQRIETNPQAEGSISMIPARNEGPHHPLAHTCHSPPSLLCLLDCFQHSHRLNSSPRLYPLIFA